MTLQTVHNGAYQCHRQKQITKTNSIALTTASEETDENVAKFSTSVAWYKVNASCFFCIIAGMTSDIVKTVEDQADRNES